MDRSAHHRRLEAMYHGAPVNRWFAPSLEVGDGTARLTMAVRRDMYHAADAAHGVVYFKVLDDAAFFAANSRIEDVFALTARLDVRFLRPVHEGLLTATARVVGERDGRLVAEAEARDGSGALVGSATGEFARSRIRLRDVPGYASRA